MKKSFLNALFITTILLTTLGCTIFNLFSQQPETRDISSAILTEDDVPEGYQRLSEEELVSQGLTGDALTSDFSLENARGQNVSAFLNEDPEKFGLILSMVIYPLNQVESLSMDVELFINDLSNDNYASEMVKSFGQDAALMPEAYNIGDKSVGVSFTPRDLVMYDGRGEIILFRQSNALGMIMVSHMPQSEINAVELAAVLNDRLEEILH